MSEAIVSKVIITVEGRDVKIEGENLGNISNFALNKVNRMLLRTIRNDKRRIVRESKAGKPNVEEVKDENKSDDAVISPGMKDEILAKLGIKTTNEVEDNG